LNLIRVCVERPVAVTVGVILVVLFGLLSLANIPIQLTPNVDTPIVTITTMWRGANPQEVEREIIDRQEEQLRSVKGLRKMTSASSDGAGTVTLEFYPSVDKNEALRDVVDKLNRVTGYPLDMDEPSIAAADTARDSEIAWLILYATDGNDESVPEQLSFAMDEIKPYLDRVDGVGSTDIYGGREREVQVRVDAGRLAARGLTFQQVEAALRQQNHNISAGTRAQGKRDYAVRTVGQYEDPQQILDTVIAYTPGGPVYIRDVAKVERTFQKPFSFVRSMGQYVLAIPVRRETGTNVMQVMEGVKAAVQRINEEVLQTRGLKLELRQVYDETHYISQSIDMIRDNLIYGGMFTVAVIWFFLRNWRATLIIALSIPISVIATFVIMVAMGRTLNVISLAGLAFAIGTVVDSAVVVLENIFRHRQEGKSALQATLDGTHEVWGAVLAGAGTAIAVFAPVVFMQEEAGQLFRDIAIATAASVALSVLVSITVVPPLAARLLGERSGTLASLTAARSAMGDFVAKIVARVNRSTMLRAGTIAAFLLVCFGLTPLLIPPTTYLPAGNRNLIFGMIFTPPGYSQDEYKRMGGVVEGVISPYWKTSEGSPEKAELDRNWIEMVKGMEAAGPLPGLAQDSGDGVLKSWFGLWPWLEKARIRREWYTPPPCIDNFFFVAFGSTCFMGATSADDARVTPLVRLLTSSTYRIPGAFGFFSQSSLFRFGGGNNIEVQVRGENLEHVKQAALAIQMTCMARYGTFPQPSPANFALGRPELRILPNRERAADMGLTARDVGFIVEACVDGAYVGDYRESDGDIVDIVLLVEGQRERATQEIGQVPICTPSGQVVPLAAAVDMLDTTSLEQINHIERQRSVTLQIEPPETVALETLIDELKTKIVPELRESGQIPKGVYVSLAGNADKLEEARNSMVGKWEGWTLASLKNVASSRFFLSVLITYLLMAALFESWLYPFVMMFSVPLAIFGGFVGLSLARFGTLLTTYQPIQQLDVLTFLGFVILVGTVVNNGILLVDQFLIYVREHNMEPHRAIREAVQVRVRPVFMTSFTNVFGQLPLAVLPGAGSELYRGMAAVLVVGMFVATIGTLVVVPCVLSIIVDIQRAIGWGRVRAAQPA
jgi:HAE1 family hydrophobic/amphiphilic exporter-1